MMEHSESSDAGQVMGPLRAISCETIEHALCHGLWHGRVINLWWRQGCEGDVIIDADGESVLRVQPRFVYTSCFTHGALSPQEWHSGVPNKTS